MAAGRFGKGFIVILNNRFYSYVMNNRPVAAGTQNIYTVRAERDFHCFDISGIPDVASIELCEIDIFFPGRGVSNISSQPIRAPLLGAPAPADSSWLFPFLLAETDIMTVTVNNRHVANFDFDLGFFGYNREVSLPLGGCPPDKWIYYYVFDWGDTVLAGAADQRQNVRITSGYDFVGLGTVATPNAAASDTLEFKIVIDSRSMYWMKQYIMGNAVFPNPLATPRRIRWRFPQLFRSQEEISIYMNNISGGPVTNVAAAIYGYHVPKGISETEVMADWERYEKMNER